MSKPLNDSKLLARISELEVEIKKLKSRKKYGLVWENKPEAVVEICKDKLPVLVEESKKAINTIKDKPVNIIIEGDNYHSLSVLNYTHNKKIDFIYIDPPYNTGARDWKYNNDYVDSSDSFRHSKWISLMSKRLILSKNLLKDDGVICATIDDNELPTLWLLMGEIFGEQNHLGTVIVRNNPKGRMSNKKISLTHEYAIFFGKSSSSSIKKLPVAPEDKTHNYEKDKDGSWFLAVNLRKQGVDSTAYNKKGKLSDRFFPIYFNPKTKEVSSKNKYEIEILPIDPNGEKRIWRRAKDVIDEMCKKGDLWVKEKKGNYQIYYKFRGGLEGQMPKSIWYDSKYSASEYGTQILDSIMGSRETFQYPKSPNAVVDSILAGTNKKNAVILDYFAGSGTTGHAVMMLNKEDGGDRKFILCTNNENDIATKVCYPRLKNAIKGHKDYKGITGFNENLRYFRTDFVEAKQTDMNKKKLVEKSTEMLCLKEDCFELFKKGNNFKIFTDKKDKFLGVIYDDKGIDLFKQEIKKINKKIIVYVFSLDDSAREEELDDVKKLVELKPIPAVILNVYKQIFK